MKALLEVILKTSANEEFFFTDEEITVGEVADRWGGELDEDADPDEIAEGFGEVIVYRREGYDDIRWTEPVKIGQRQYDQSSSPEECADDILADFELEREQNEVEYPEEMTRSRMEG